MEMEEMRKENWSLKEKVSKLESENKDLKCKYEEA